MDSTWESHLRTFQTTRVPDGTLASAIIEAVSVFNDDVLYNLIATVNSGRRVFKHLCLKGRIPPLPAFVKLQALGETDLAFHVVYCHSMWPFVLQLYQNAKVLAISRQRAFNKALRQGVWEVVTQMITSNVGNTAQRRRTAFREAVRRDQLQAAYQLYNGGVGLDNNNTLVCALQACVRLKLWDTAVDFLKKLPLAFIRSHRDLLSNVIKVSIENGRLLRFLYLAKERCPMMRNRFHLRILFTEALEKKYPSFILKFCKRCCDQLPALRVATNVAVQSCKWRLLSMLAELDEFDLSELELHQTMKKTLNWKNARSLCAPILEYVLTTSSKVDFEHFFDRFIIRPHRAPSSTLATWCLTNSYYHLAIVLALRSLNWDLITDILQQHATAMSGKFLDCMSSTAYRRGEWDTTVAFLRYLQSDANFRRAVVPYPTIPNRSLIQKCKEEGRRKQAIRIATASNDWDLVKEETETCHDQSILDHTILQAAKSHKWDVVQILMHRCSSTREALAFPLALAVIQGQSEIAKCLIGRIDPRVVGEGDLCDDCSESLMQVAVSSNFKREEMVKLCIEAGLSPLDTAPLSSKKKETPVCGGRKKCHSERVCVGRHCMIFRPGSISL